MYDYAHTDHNIMHCSHIRCDGAPSTEVWFRWMHFGSVERGLVLGFLINQWNRFSFYDNGSYR